MARYFQKDEWNDILIAFPFNPREMDEINDLGKQVTLTIMIPNLESARLLSSLATSNLNVMIKIDTGYGRSGTNWDETDILHKISKAIAFNKKAVAILRKP